jgi:hypothetical protein
VSPDGAIVSDFQRPPRLGRIAFAPDGYLDRASVFSNVGWTMTSSLPIVHWVPPARR